MLLQTVRPNIVQSIRAFRVEDLMQAAQADQHHFLYANLTSAQSKQELIDHPRGMSYLVVQGRRGGSAMAAAAVNAIASDAE